MEQWLVRTEQNVIRGPYSKERIRQMILNSELTFQDEICVANGYWINIHEAQEIRDQLGIELPRPTLPEVDKTTETEQPDLSQEEVTNPDLSVNSLEQKKTVSIEQGLVKEGVDKAPSVAKMSSLEVLGAGSHFQSLNWVKVLGIVLAFLFVGFYLLHRYHQFKRGG